MIFTENIFERISRIVPIVFPNGIRVTSIIDIKKLRRSYLNKYGEELPLEIDISTFLEEIGIKTGEKIYVLTDKQKQVLIDLIIRILEEGYEVIYYSELIAYHIHIFESCHLYETTIVQKILKNLFPEMIFKDKRVYKNRDSNEYKEIEKAYGKDVVLNYQQIKRRCPYLALDAIRNTLIRSKKFVWSSAETFALTELIQLDFNEVCLIKENVLPKIQTNGYYSLAKLPIDESCSMNPGVNISAVRDVVFLRYLANQCDRRGLIVTRKGVHISSGQLIEAWCKDHDRFTIWELVEYEHELMDRHAVLGVSIACNTVVRINHDTFVSDALISFDVDAIDRAIALFVGNRVIPITEITSFTSFPDVEGYSWNLYLVESFLRRFSIKFTIDGGPAQMSYVGGICRKEQVFESYEDRLAFAVIQDGIELSEDCIGRYLTEKRFIIRRSNIVRKVFEKARIIAEKRGEYSVRI